jgi:nifR3 family TIM-barrel protein
VSGIGVLPLRFGGLEVGFPVIQAALSGYSDFPMRMISRKFGAEFVVSEVLLDQFVVSVSRRKSRLYFAGQNEHPCGAQVMGNDVLLICRAVERLIEVGFDLVDLNFACPVKKVLSRGRGGNLLREPDVAVKIIDGVSRVIGGVVPLTIKLRKGFDDSDRSRNNFFTILDHAVNSGVCGFTVHGRTVQQRYEGKSDWNFVREVKKHLLKNGNTDIMLVGSGDLFGAEDALCKMRQSGVNGLSLARGVIGNPWLFRDIKSIMFGGVLPERPDIVEQGGVLREHFELAVNFYGELHATTAMRAFAVHYSKLHPQTTNVRADFVKAKTINDWNDILKKWYGS